MTNLIDRLVGKTMTSKNGQEFKIESAYHMPDKSGLRLIIVVEINYPNAHNLADLLENDMGEAFPVIKRD